MTTIKKVQAVIYRMQEDIPQFLIMHRILHWSGWELVKGTPEKKESPRQTILREIKEETKLKDVKIVKSWKKRILFTGEGGRYEITDLFLVKAAGNGKVKIDQKIQEHDGYLWVTKEQALKMLTYPNARKVLEGIKAKEAK